MKYIMGSLLVSGAMLLATTAVVPLAANAAESQTGSTDVTATFTAGDTDVNPVDPNNPSTPGTDPTGDGNNGATPGSGLSLIYVTNKVDFGSNSIDVVNDENYTADKGNTSTLWNGKAVAEVSDTRGTNAGWQLTVSGTPFKADNGDTLKGATLSYGTAALSNTGSDTNNAAAAKVSDITAAGETNVMNAAKGDGAGITIAQFDPANISLNVLANTAKSQAYSSTLTWTLSELPAE